MLNQASAAKAAKASGAPPREAELMTMLRRRINIAETEVPKLLGLSPEDASSVIGSLESQGRLMRVQRSDQAGTVALQLAPRSSSKA